MLYKNISPSPYQRQIDLLQALIEDWYEPEKKYLWNIVWGLCDNCLLYSIPTSLRHEMFRAWKYYNGDLTFPVDSLDEFFDPDYIPLNNPLRLNLAVHCLRYLKALK